MVGGRILTRAGRGCTVVQNGTVQLYSVGLYCCTKCVTVQLYSVGLYSYSYTVWDCTVIRCGCGTIQLYSVGLYCYTV